MVAAHSTATIHQKHSKLKKQATLNQTNLFDYGQTDL